MRQIALLFYALFFGLLLTACGGHPAEKTAVSFYTNLLTGKTEKAISLSTLGNQMDGRNQMDGIVVGKMKAIIDETLRQKGGYQKVTVDSKTPSKITEDSAIVYVIIYFGDGTRERECVQVKKVNNQWKVVF